MTPGKRPAAMCFGPGHRVVYANGPFIEAFGRATVGLPAREALLTLPAAAFALLDAVYAGGRPLGRWLRLGGEQWRLTCAPRVDVESGVVYGVTFHLRERWDLPILADAAA